MAQTLRQRRTVRNFVAKHAKARGGAHGKTKGAQRRSDKQALEAAKKDNFSRYSGPVAGW